MIVAGAPSTVAAPPAARGGRVAFGVVAAAWVVLLGAILRHPIYVSHDSVSNYAHVWYVSERLWHDHVLPLHMPLIGHGRALAFPYAFLPWVSAALLRPVLGDWVVTLWLVLGFVGVAAATFWAFPELDLGWWGAAALVNPALVMAPLSGQLPFLWAMAFLLAAVGCWRRGRRWPATLLAGLGMATHPAVAGPVAALLVAGWLPFERQRASLLWHAAVAALIASPAVLAVLASPVFSESSPGVIVEQFVRTVGVRLAVVVVPLALVALRGRPRAWLAPAAFAAVLVVNPLLVGPDTDYAWGAPLRWPDGRTAAFIRSPAFSPGATYRVLSYSDGKVGMYRLIQHGARLDAELFPESIDRRSWDGVAGYERFLQARGVADVMIWRSYDRRYRTNEHALLEAMAADVTGSCVQGGLEVTPVVHDPAFDVFRVAACRGS